MKTFNLEQLVVLLIEPSSTQRHIIGEFLTISAIHHLDCVENGQEALQAMEYQKPHLVISAMHLPDMTGTELIETMRSREDLRDIAFILISSETKMSYIEAIRQAGAVAILPKPFEYEQLRKALMTTLDFIDPEQLELAKYDAGALAVLLVDDSRFSRQHILRTLNNIGIKNITEAENGKAAIALLENHHFDLILTDYNMPEMDGKELIAFIRGMEKFTHTPILMVTSETDMSRLTAVDQIGVSAIIDKPFESDLIKNLIQKIMT